MVAFSANEQVVLGLNVNGIDVPIHSDGYNQVSVYSNSVDVLPSSEISFKDSTGALFDQMPVSSGTPFTVTIGGYTGRLTIPMKISGVPSITRDGIATLYTINGIYDKLKFMMDRPKLPYLNMPSMAVCAAVAAECGLRPDIHPTTDIMTWFAGPNQTFADFFHSVVDRGYRDAKSIMAAAVLDTGIMRYKNLSQVMQEGPKTVFQQGYGGGTEIIGYQVSDHMGFGNMKMNHGLRLIQEQLTGEANKLVSFAVPLLSGSLGMNAADKAGTNNARTEYAAPDAGNTHENYKQAEYQNKRGRVTFGLRVNVMCKEPQDAHVYDLVEFKVRNPATGQPSVYNGRYIVMSKTRHAAGAHYYEKLELASQGINGDTSGQFLSPSSILNSFTNGLF